MTWQHIHFVRQLSLPALQKLVLFALASRANDSGECWPSIQTLRIDTGLAHRTVQYHLNTLVKRGVVLREERRGCSALLRLQLCASRAGASDAGVQNQMDGVHDTPPPLQEVHATYASAAAEVKQELPINPQEEARARYPQPPQVTTNPTTLANTVALHSSHGGPRIPVSIVRGAR